MKKVLIIISIIMILMMNPAYGLKNVEVNIIPEKNVLQYKDSGEETITIKVIVTGTVEKRDIDKGKIITDLIEDDSGGYWKSKEHKLAPADKIGARITYDETFTVTCRKIKTKGIEGGELVGDKDTVISEPPIEELKVRVNGLSTLYRDINKNDTSITCTRCRAQGQNQRGNQYYDKDYDECEYGYSVTGKSLDHLILALAAISLVIISIIGMRKKN